MGNMDYPDILHLSSGFVQSMIHSSNIINNVAVFFPFNLTGGGGGGGGGGGLALMSVFVNPSHDLQTFDSVCVHPSHDLHFWQCVHPPHDLHIWQCLCWSISWQYCYLLLLTVFVQPSHDLQTLLTMCSSISWPADTFDNVCVHPSHDLQTRLTSVFIHLMTCRHF